MINYKKFAKLDKNGNIEYPPHNDGNIINCHLNLKWLEAHGFEQQTDEWFIEHSPKHSKENEQIFYSKYKIKQELDKLNKWSEFKSILEQYNKLDDFILAQVLSNKDENFLLIKDVIENQLKINNINDLLKECLN